MTGGSGRRAATISPGPGTAVVGPGGGALVDEGADGPSCAALIRALGDGEGFGPTIEVLAASGVGRLPSFGLIYPEAAAVRIVVRGSVTATIDASDGSTRIVRGLDLATWAEVICSDADVVTVSLDAPAGPEVGQLALVSGVATAGTLALDLRPARLGGPDGRRHKAHRPASLDPSPPGPRSADDRAPSAEATGRSPSPRAEGGEPGPCPAATSAVGDEAGLPQQQASPFGFDLLLGGVEPAAGGVARPDGDGDPHRRAAGGPGVDPLDEPATDRRPPAAAPEPPPPVVDVDVDVDVDDGLPERTTPVVPVEPEAKMPVPTVSASTGSRLIDRVPGAPTPRPAEGPNEPAFPASATLVTEVPRSGSVPVPEAAPASTTAPPLEPDHLDSPTRARASSRPATADGSGGPRVQAVHCPNRHPNPPDAERCRRCDAVVVDREITTIDRPTVGTLRFSDGTVAAVDGPLLVGRMPATDVEIDGQIARAVALHDHEKMLSRTHLAIHLSGWQVQVVDRDSMNHTFLALPGEEPILLLAGEPYPVPLGSTIDLGEAVQGTLDAGP